MGEIRKNQKVKLNFKTADGSEKELDCLIKEIYTDRLSLTTTEEILKYSEYLSEGEELVAKIFTPVGVKVISTIILDSPLENDFIIEFAEVSTEIQRREYLRVPLDTKVVIQRSLNDNIVTRTIDISGGGIRFNYNGEFYPKEEVDITLYLPDMKMIQANGIIIKNNHLPTDIHILSFNKIDENDRDKIIKKCFEIQSKLLENKEIK